VQNNVSSPFGPRGGRAHNGTDYGTPIGTSVWASADGEVTAVVTSCDLNGYIGNRCGGGFGNHIVISHANNYTTTYAHLHPDEIYVSPGDEVTQGQVIAQTGNSGSSTGPHLHFELRRSGSPLNPEAYVEPKR
jgi:murein DD-endopeptidase MepM/ murein hydrolase activator NlpD